MEFAGDTLERRSQRTTVVPFGLTASAHLAVRSMNQAAREAKIEFPAAAKGIEEDFYMDDCSTGADSDREAIKLMTDVKHILNGAGFELSKWKSNSDKVLRHFGAELENTEIVFSAGDGTTILGLKWLIDEDKFTFQLQ